MKKTNQNKAMGNEQAISKMHADIERNIRYHEFSRRIRTSLALYECTGRMYGSSEFYSIRSRWGLADFSYEKTMEALTLSQTRLSELEERLIGEGAQVATVLEACESLSKSVDDLEAVVHENISKHKQESEVVKCLKMALLMNVSEPRYERVRCHLLSKEDELRKKNIDDSIYFSEFYPLIKETIFDEMLRRSLRIHVHSYAQEAITDMLDSAFVEAESREVLRVLLRGIERTMRIFKGKNKDRNDMEEYKRIGGKDMNEFYSQTLSVLRFCTHLLKPVSEKEKEV